MAENRTIMTVDAHSDYPLEILHQRRLGKRKVFETQHLTDLKRGGVQVEVSTVGGDFTLDSDGAVFDYTDPRIVLETLDAVHQELAESPEVSGLVLTGDDFDRILAEGKAAILLNLEGVKCVGDDFSLFRNFYRLGVRALSLTHDPRNLMADGCKEGRDSGGLSALGKSFVEELNNYNLVLDLVHINEQSFFDVLEIYEAPVVVSHSNANGVFESYRNLSDAQIKAVAERGGAIGINFLGFMSHAEPEKAEVSHLIDHIDYMVDLVGVEHIGMGPDYVNYYMDIILRLVERMGVSPGFVSMPDGLEGVANLQNMAEALAERGYSDEHIRMLMGENFLRVLKMILGRDPS